MIVEMAVPHLCSWVSLDPGFMDLGKQKVQEGIQTWAECLATGDWPGYPNRIMQISAPPWAIAQFEERKFNAQLLQQSGEDGLPF